MLFSSEVTASIQNAAKDAGFELLDNAYDQGNCTQNCCGIAPIIGKEPPDYHIWLQSGTPPVFVREEGPLYEGGPVWRSARPSPNNLRPCTLAQIAHLIGALRIADMPVRI
jgi:hypothetical protein